MLTVAEEQGLSGLALASQVQHALYRLPDGVLAELIERLREGARERHVIYLHDGELDPIRILPCPIAILPSQLSYIHAVTMIVQEAIKRFPALYFSDHRVREILRLPDPEERWLRECWAPSQQAHNPIFGRLDALIDFTSPMWRESLKFVEPNLTGIGGVHMVPTAERLLAEIVVPALHRVDPDLRLEVGQDMRDLLVRTRFSITPPQSEAARRSASSSRSIPVRAPTSRSRWPPICVITTASPSPTRIPPS